MIKPVHTVLLSMAAVSQGRSVPRALHDCVHFDCRATFHGVPAHECNDCEACDEVVPDACERHGKAPGCGMRCCDGSTLDDTGTCVPDYLLGFLPLGPLPGDGPPCGSCHKDPKHTKVVINGESCLLGDVVDESANGNRCDPGGPLRPIVDRDGDVCANDGTKNQAYCSYDRGLKGKMVVAGVDEWGHKIKEWACVRCAPSSEEVTATTTAAPATTTTDPPAVVAINGKHCALGDVVTSEGHDCWPSWPHFDHEGMECASDMPGGPYYCSYGVGPTACAKCAPEVVGPTDRPAGRIEDFEKSHKGKCAGRLLKKYVVGSKRTCLMMCSTGCNGFDYSKASGKCRTFGKLKNKAKRAKKTTCYRRKPPADL